jgi:DNA repair protein RecO (recombination protein O)
LAARLEKQRFRSAALLLRRTALREADLIVDLFTEELGTVSAIARGARRSSKRFSALEPMHLLRVSVELSRGRELGTLTEATLQQPRIALTSSLARMEGAGHVLRWLRRAAPQRVPEPELWRESNELLEALDGAEADVDALVAAAGLRILAAAGWGLELDRCVRCGKPCPQRARGIVDVRAGGVVCRACGGVGTTLSSKQRAALIAVVRGDLDAALSCDDALVAIKLVDQALEAHGRGEGT